MCLKHKSVDLCKCKCPLGQPHASWARIPGLANAPGGTQTHQKWAPVGTHMSLKKKTLELRNKLQYQKQFWPKKQPLNFIKMSCEIQLSLSLSLSLSPSFFNVPICSASPSRPASAWRPGCRSSAPRSQRCAAGSRSPPARDFRWSPRTCKLETSPFCFGVLVFSLSHLIVVSMLLLISDWSTGKGLLRCFCDAFAMLLRCFCYVLFRLGLKRLRILGKQLIMQSISFGGKKK